jgi:hypothetical protein
MNHGSARIALSIDDAAQQANVCRDKIYQSEPEPKIEDEAAGESEVLWRRRL